MRSVVELLASKTPASRSRLTGKLLVAALLGILAVVSLAATSQTGLVSHAEASAPQVLAANSISAHDHSSPAESYSAADSQKNTPSFPAVSLRQILPTSALESHIYYLADREGAFDARYVINQFNHFIPLNKKPIAFRTRSHWHALHIENDLNATVERFITTGVSTAPLLQAYWVTPQLQRDNQAPLPAIQSQIAYGFPTLLFNLHLSPGERGILLIEYQSIAHFPLTLHIYDSAQLFKSTQLLKVANGIYIGAIGMLFLFFFGHFLFSRERVYFYYSMFVLFGILIMMQMSGPAQLFNQNDTNKTMLITLIGGGIYTFYFIFTAEFLQLKQRNRLLYRALLLLSASVLCLTIISVIYPTAYALSIVIALGLPFPVISAVWAWRRKVSSALFFLVGSLAHCVSTYFLLFACLGFAPFRNELIIRIASLGLMFDILCFAMAIIYHGNQVRIHYNRQLLERINDLNALAESERLSAKALSLSKQSVLNLAATAHDLQQPLSAMQLLLSLQNSADPTIQNVQGALNYACSLLNSALGDARQNYQTLVESVDARSFLLAAQARHQARFSEKNLAVRVVCPSYPLTCLPIVVNRILDNLLSNALKYTTAGTVLLTGRRHKNGSFLLQIWDTGRGMNQKYVQHLTTPFERIQDTEELGFGLGLFIVKSLCHQAGYRFTIASKEQRGTCVGILITPVTTQQRWLDH